MGDVSSTAENPLAPSRWSMLIPTPRFSLRLNAWLSCWHRERHGGDCRMWLDIWLRQKRVVRSDRTCDDLPTLSDSLHLAATCGQYDSGASLCCERICRRKHAVCHAYEDLKTWRGLFARWCTSSAGATDVELRGSPRRGGTNDCLESLSLGSSREPPSRRRGSCCRRWSVSTRWEPWRNGSRPWPCARSDPLQCLTRRNRCRRNLFSLLAFVPDLYSRWRATAL